MCKSILSPMMRDVQIIFVTLYSTFSFTALMLNIFVLYLFVRFKRLRTSNNKFLVSLAIGDLLVAFVLGPIAIAEIVLGTAYQVCGLVIAGTILTTLMAVSGVTIGCIAYDRYLQVQSKVMYARKMTKWKLNLLVIMPWFSPLILMASKFMNPIVNAVFVITMIVLVYGALLFSYFFLMGLVRQKNRHEKTGVKTLNHLNLRNKTAVYFMGWLLCAAIVCSLPVLLNKLLTLINLIANENWSFYERNRPLFTATARFSFLINCNLNPILYFFRHPEFKKAAKKIWQGKRKVRIYPADAESSSNKPTPPIKLQKLAFMF